MLRNRRSPHIGADGRQAPKPSCLDHSRDQARVAAYGSRELLSEVCCGSARSYSSVASGAKFRPRISGGVGVQTLTAD
jgi:hypothetical protein